MHAVCDRRQPESARKPLVLTAGLIYLSICGQPPEVGSHEKYATMVARSLVIHQTSFFAARMIRAHDTIVD